MTAKHLIWRFTMPDGSGVYNTASGEYIPTMRGLPEETIDKYTHGRPAPAYEPKFQGLERTFWVWRALYGFGSIPMAKQWFDVWSDLQYMTRKGARLRAFYRSDADNHVDGDWQTLFTPTCSRYADFPADALYSMSEAELIREATKQLKAKPCHATA